MAVVGYVLSIVTSYILAVSCRFEQNIHHSKHRGIETKTLLGKARFIERLAIQQRYSPENCLGKKV